MFEPTIREGVLRLRRPETRWLSSGWNGGFWTTSTAYNISVPDGWDRTDLGTYTTERRHRAGFEPDGPALLTGVNLDHVHGARDGSVEAFVTAGISNPAALPMGPLPASDEPPTTDESTDVGTVNVIVGTDRALDDAALTNLLTVAVEAKTATLLSETGFPGTTTDAVIVASDPTGEPAEFTGSATPIGNAARACVRDATRASIRSRYSDGELPSSVEDAAYGVSTTRRADVFKV